jgi:hypothetical protein
VESDRNGKAPLTKGRNDANRVTTVQPPPLHDRLRRQSPRTHKVCEAYLGGKYNLEMVTSIKYPALPRNDQDTDARRQDAVKHVEWREHVGH